jgi:mannose-6-phosphate isomerase-like protein (cupin superfamily)
MADETALEILSWTESGYKPLVFAAGWQVALMNWEPLYDLESAGEIERHNHTDEVFVLLTGRAVMIVVTPAGVQVEDMQPGVIYNVRKGVWHNNLSTRDASWVIVEDRDTHLHDNGFRQLTAEELAALKAQLPDWVT